ncbi:MAG: hypothetical protein ACLFTS_00810, partial [Candidatus Paceibacterota bacterium]
MKNLSLIILIILIITGLYLIMADEQPNEEKISEEEEKKAEEETELEIEYIGEDTQRKDIKVLEENGEEVFSLNIDDLNQWTKENWDIFEEPPMVAMREVEPDSFDLFDNSATVSPDQEKLAMSVHDYAAATTLSFIIIADLNSGDLDMIKEPTRGSIEEFLWSPDSKLAAYTLNTARAHGDMLSVDDTDSMEKVTTLEGDDLIEKIKDQEDEDDKKEFMPRFRDVKWEDNEIHFKT